MNPGLAAALALLVQALMGWPATPPEAVYLIEDAEPVRGVYSAAEARRLGATAAWVWTASSAPRRLAGEELTGPHSPPPRDPIASVRVVAGAALPADAVIVAAPPAMWQEVEEDLLPAWPVIEGRARIPRPRAAPLRIRLFGPGIGSPWRDIESQQEAPTVAAELAPTVTLLVDAPEAPVTTVRFLEAPRGARPPAELAHRRGRSRIELPSLPQDRWLLAAVEAPGYEPVILEGPPSVFDRVVTLPAGAGLWGTVVDVDGNGLDGVEVRVETWAAGETPVPVVRETLTTSGGHFAVEGLPAGASAALVLEKRGFGRRVETVEVPDRGDLGLGRLALTPGRTLTVLVADDLGRPLVGAVVAAAGQQHTTDSRGVAVLDSLASGVLRIHVQAEGHLDRVVQHDPATEPEVTTHLERGFLLVGRFLDRERVVPPQASARVVQGARFVETALTSAGEFALTLDPGVPGTLHVRSPSTRELALAIEPGAPGELRDLGLLSPPPDAAAVGRVVRPDGTPIGGARIWTAREPGWRGIAALVHRDRLEVRSGATGEFRLSGLGRGPATIRVEAPGAAWLDLEIELTDEHLEEDLDLGEVVVSPGTTVRVLLASGVEAAPGAVARLGVGGGWSPFDRLQAPVTAREAVLEHVPSGPALVTVASGGELVCEEQVVVPEARDLEVECGPALVVQGIVRGGGPGTLRWLSARGPGEGAFGFNLSTPAGQRRSYTVVAGRPDVAVTVGADGGFRTTSLAPGSWTVVWESTAPAESGAGLREVLLPDARELVLELSFYGVTVTGTVRSETGQPVADAVVRDTRSGTSARTGAEGAYRLEGLAPGLAVLVAHRQSLIGVPLTLELPADGEVRAPDLVLAPSEPFSEPQPKKR